MHSFAISKLNKWLINVNGFTNSAVHYLKEHTSVYVLQQKNMANVVVIGAGIVGLSSAVRLQQMRKDVRVTVIADQWGENTTSAGAAGLFRPTPELIKDVESDTLISWIEDSWQHFTELALSADAADAGVFHVTGYHVYRAGEVYTQKPNLLRKLCPNYRQMTTGEWALINCKRPFLCGGGKLEIRKVESFDEFVGKADLVMNCTGLRASELEPDFKLVANRGQVLRVHAPWIKHFMYVDMDTWIIPCLDDVVVGGTRQHNNESQVISQKDTDDVWQRACSYVPSLKASGFL